VTSDPTEAISLLPVSEHELDIIMAASDSLARLAQFSRLVGGGTSELPAQASLLRDLARRGEQPTRYVRVEGDKP
jgi:hypothetical protein